MTIALGGVWDEAQIRGLSIAFRSPEADRIVKGLLDAGVCNPVFVLDEIDKVARRGSFGDPSAALLEVLDPQQNHAFHDCYADVGVDLSEVLFIATANRLETVPAALRDRMEVIEVPGYSAEEKLPIVRKHLLPRQIEASGLRAGRLWTGVPEAPCGEKPAAVAEAAPVEMTDTAIRALIRDHTCEAGVRQLERLVGAVCQHVAFRRVAAGEAAPVTVVADAREAERLGTKAQQYVTIEELFGAPRYGSLPDAVRETVSRKWERVFALHPADPEAAAARAWIEVVEDLPWGPPAIRPRPEAPDLRRLLDNAYVGRDEEKEQVLDHLAARGLTRQAARSPDAAGDGEEPGGADGAATGMALCFWGPHGVGRTAFAAAVATALGRRCVRVPLAGARDAAAVRGVVRSGREAAPGRIVTALRQNGEPPERKGSDPLCVLGGIDRMNHAAAHALLDVLAPVRNRAFRDHYECAGLRDPLADSSPSSARHGDPGRPGGWGAAFVAPIEAEVDALIGPRRVDAQDFEAIEQPAPPTTGTPASTPRHPARAADRSTTPTTPAAVPDHDSSPARSGRGCPALHAMSTGPAACARCRHRAGQCSEAAAIEPQASPPAQGARFTSYAASTLIRYAGEQIGRRPALDDPVANLRQPARVGNILQRGGQPPRCGRVELALRQPAQQRPFFGSALRDPLLAALRDPLLAALRDPLLAAFFDPLLGPLPNLFRQHRAHLLQPRQRPGLPTPETPRQQHLRHPRPERLRQLLVTLLAQQTDQRPPTTPAAVPDHDSSPARSAPTPDCRPADRHPRRGPRPAESTAATADTAPAPHRPMRSVRIRPPPRSTAVGRCR